MSFTYTEQLEQIRNSNGRRPHIPASLNPNPQHPQEDQTTSFNLSDEAEQYTETKLGPKQTLFILGFVALFMEYFIILFKYVWGQWHFWADFLNGIVDHHNTEACTSLKAEEWPLQYLAAGEYFRLQRCLGNEYGFERQGSLISMSRDAVIYLLGPFVEHPLGAVFIIFIFVLYGLPWVSTKMHAVLGYILTVPRNWWPLPVVLFCFLFAYNTDFVLPGFWVTTVFAGGLFAAVVAHVFPEWKQSLRNAWPPPLFLGIRDWIMGRGALPPEVEEEVHDFQSGVPKASARSRTNESMNDVTSLRRFLTEYDEEIERTRAERNYYISVAKSAKQELEAERIRHAVDVRSLPSSPQPADVLSDLLRQSRIKRDTLEQENRDLIRRFSMFENQTKISLSNMQSKLSWQQGIGDERENTKQELDAANRNIRKLQRDIYELNCVGSETRQQLAYEREQKGTGKCHNNATCQNEIRDLREGVTKVWNTYCEAETLARKSAKMIKKDIEEDHVSIQGFITDATQKILNSQALGINGEITTDMQVATIKAQLELERQYLHRLEDECNRLGGNVMDVKMGLDTRRPISTKTDIATYDEEAQRVFNHYKKLTEKIELLSQIYHTANKPQPQCLEEPARNDQEALLSKQQLSWERLGLSNKYTNPTHKHDEILRQKLMLGEISRWYNYGVVLTRDLRELDEKGELCPPVGDQRDKITHALKETDKDSNSAARDVLDGGRQLIQSTSDRSPSPRQKRKFMIYLAMQKSIAELTTSVLENKRIPPPWVSPTPPQHRNRPRNSVSELAANLMSFELHTLETRILQLKQFTHEHQLPGTLAGPALAKIQGDPGYEVRWQKFVAGITFSDLALSAWRLYNDQKYTNVLDGNGVVVGREWLPKIDLLPPVWDEFHESIYGTKPVKEGETKDENAWPKGLEAELKFDGVEGPRFVMRKKKENDDNHNTNHNKNSNQYQNQFQIQDQKQGTNTAIGNARREWTEHQQRVIQLWNWITDKGLRGNMPEPRTNERLRENASLGTINDGIKYFEGQANMLTSKLTGHKLPKWPKNGGPMRPN